jgi:hypothetical protein
MLCASVFCTLRARFIPGSRNAILQIFERFALAPLDLARSMILCGRFSRGFRSGETRELESCYTLLMEHLV